MYYRILRKSRKIIAKTWYYLMHKPFNRFEQQVILWLLFGMLFGYIGRMVYLACQAG